MKILSILSLIIFMGCGEAFADEPMRCIRMRDKGFMVDRCEDDYAICYLTARDAISCFPTPKSK